MVTKTLSQSVCVWGGVMDDSQGKAPAWLRPPQGSLDNNQLSPYMGKASGVAIEKPPWKGTDREWGWEGRSRAADREVGDDGEIT